ncbi:unnamed protein product, partial [Laminaria digitata]
MLTLSVKEDSEQRAAQTTVAAAAAALSTLSGTPGTPPPPRLASSTPTGSARKSAENRSPSLGSASARPTLVYQSEQRSLGQLQPANVGSGGMRPSSPFGFPTG